MKIKNFALGLMACAAFTACSNEEFADNTGGGKLEGNAYVAIKIVTPGVTGTRAANDFEAGTGDESKVNSATFLFFDAAGNPCANKTVSGEELKEWTTDTDPSHSTEQISTPVLLLNPVSGVMPASVIAVLNAPAEDLPMYGNTKLSLFKSMIGSNEAYKKGFIMSNSVYGKNGKAVMEVPLTIENLATSAELAKQHPVRIPVERIVVRVDLNKNNITESRPQEVSIDGKMVNVKAVIKGWKITATNPSSYLLKKIDIATFDRDLFPWKWNDEANTRSYWATSAVPGAYKFYTYNDAVANNNNASEYCLENTSAPWIKYPTQSTSSKLWVVAQLINTANNQPVSIMEWRGSKTTPDGVKALVASALMKYYYVKSGTVGTDATYESILTSDLKFVASADHYKAKIALANNTKKFYTLAKDAAGKIIATDATAELTDAVDKLPEALAWTDGMTYYYVNIEHNGGDANDKVYGVVRNHVYKLRLTSISGLGTPIYDPNTEIDPTKPGKEDQSFVAAEVEVLKWKVVTQDVELQ